MFNFTQLFKRSYKIIMDYQIKSIIMNMTEMHVRSKSVCL